MTRNAIYRSKQKGFTLLELMIALSIGVLLLLGLTSIYMVAHNTNSQNRVLTSNDETARQVFRIMAHDLSQAGFVDALDSPSSALTEFPSYGSESCDAAPVGTRYGKYIVDVAQNSIADIYLRYNDGTPDVFLTPIGRTSCGAMLPVLGCGAAAGFEAVPTIFDNTLSVCDENSSNDTQQAIEIAYQALAVGGHGDSNLAQIGANSTITDCSGTGVLTSQNGFVVNQYYIADDDGEPNLWCRSNMDESPPNTTATALVPGVQEMMFRYVITLGEADEDMEIGESESGVMLVGYQTAAELYTTAAAADTNLDWAAVVGVEICVVVSSPLLDGTTALQMANAQGTKRPTCARNNDGTYAVDVDKTDSDRFYQRFSRVFRLPNALYATTEGGIVK